MATFTNYKHAVLSVIRATLVVVLIVTVALVAVTHVPRRAAALAACWATHMQPARTSAGFEFDRTLEAIRACVTLREAKADEIVRTLNRSG
jgi:hypothetical protein